MKRTAHSDIIYDCIVIGGGASGLMFAAGLDPSDSSGSGDAVDDPDGNFVSGDSGFRGLILEKTGKVGSKLLISGGGRCNISHGGSIKDFPSCYGENGKRIRKILYSHSNIELEIFFRSLGIKLVEEEDGRVFPATGGKALLNALIDRGRRNGFETITGCEVTGIALRGTEGQRVVQVATSDGNEYKCRALVVATGGCSYPQTGSDGRMLEILKRDLGVTIVSPRPALHPLVVRDYPYAGLAGVSLDVTISKAGAKAKSAGKVLFTHSGFSGPAAINLSGDLAEGDAISIDYTGGERNNSGGSADVDAAYAIQERMSEGRIGMARAITELFGLPRNLAKAIEERSGGSTKEAGKILKRDEFIISARGSFSEAMVTRGGVDLEDIDLKTLHLKAYPNIYIIGEAVDVDGRTGGYNMQFAYSSAMTAANSVKNLSIIYKK